MSILRKHRTAAGGILRDSAKIGRLLNADSLFIAGIIIREESGIRIPYTLACLFPPLFWVRGGRAEILLSGRLTSVVSGEVLLSGTSVIVTDDLNGRDLEDLVQQYFAKTPKLR